MDSTDNGLRPSVFFLNTSKGVPIEATQRVCFWIEAGLSALSGGLFVLTLLLPDWIEAVFGTDPDDHSGALEWAIVVALLVTSVASTALAHREWHRRASGSRRLPESAA